MTEFSIVGCGLFTAGFPTANAWRLGTADADVKVPRGASLHRRSRRMASGLMRAFADVYEETHIQSGFDAARAASVFGSGLGEVQTMLTLLDQMWVEHEAPSPMKFAASVHNAPSGAISISHQNRAFTTSVAADYDTPAMSLMEAVGLLQTGHPEVIVACGDQESPNLLLGAAQHRWILGCAAVALSTDSDHPRRLCTVDVPHIDAQVPASDIKVHAELRANPCFGMMALVDAIVHRRYGPIRLDEGKGRGWTVHLGAP